MRWEIKLVCRLPAPLQEEVGCSAAGGALTNTHFCADLEPEQARCTRKPSEAIASCISEVGREWILLGAMHIRCAGLQLAGLPFSLPGHESFPQH